MTKTDKDATSLELAFSQRAAKNKHSMKKEKKSQKNHPQRISGLYRRFKVDDVPMNSPLKLGVSEGISF